MLFPDEDEPSVIDPSARPFLISCDESGTDGAQYYGFGSLWMKWDRRGQFQADLRRIGEEHSVKVGEHEGEFHEFKWSKVKHQKIGFYKAVVEYFFRREWLCFHCIIVKKSFVDRDLHRGGYDEARRKHFTLLLTNRIRRALKLQPHRKFRVWVDPIASSYRKADEAIEKISNRVLNRGLGSQQPVDQVITHLSHETHSIQLCDLLLGATMAAWQGAATATAKLELQNWIASHLGWTDLRGDTRPVEKKFNVWMLCDPRDRPPEIETRAVILKYPLRGSPARV